MKQKIEFASHPANLSLLRNFVQQFLDPFPFSPNDKALMILGIDEACTNIIRHSYQHEESHPIAVSCTRIKTGIRFRLRDFGAQSEPHRLEGRPLDDVQPGGLGLHLIRRAFDQVDYIFKIRGTELVLEKHFRSPQNPQAIEG